jgi:transcriptional regulator with XRE-family HTH domain
MNNPINVKFGQMIKDLSRQKNRSMADLAEITGLSLDAIEKIEKGESGATVEIMIKLAEALSIHPSQLFEWY